MAVEEADYRVLLQQDALEIREYAPSIVAEVVVKGDFEDASSAAFRKLFNYISGDNTGREKVAMTAPESQKPKSEKIAMTSPVTMSLEDSMTMMFMVPKYTV